ncbi:MAG: PD40 domain-containing protein, partial [Gemmatimonadetes bacterium]|nr:PD40 domain-containing protein [Gemmatimonadota bacterium]
MGIRRAATRALVSCAPLALALLARAPDAPAQYFGRNKVQYQDFDWRVLETEHFRIHFYPEETEAVQDAARMSERWYARLGGLFRHQFRGRKPLIFYADHPDFQQTNVISGLIPEATGGVTEALKNRVTMPLTGTYRENDHVLGHELVHAFQYDLAGGAQGGGLAALSRLPLWLVEGMAEYLSLGREDPHTAMWLRDAALRGELPTIEQLTRDPRFFPYRYGQALWAYIGGRWGDAAVTQLFRTALRQGWERALDLVLGMDDEALSREWLAAIRAAYFPAVVGRTAPREAGELLLGQKGAGGMNLGPVISPDGRHVAFFSRRELFTIDLYLADARTGKVLKKLASPATDAHFDALSFINSAGAWSPDGRRFAFVVFAGGDNELAILDVERRRVEKRVRVRGVGAVSTPAWSPDGRRLAFSGSSGGISDLYLLDLEKETVRQLTRDRFADLHPAWSPDGRTLAFATDRGGDTDFQRLVYARLGIGLLDVEALTIRLLRPLGDAKHVNPQFSPDGRDLFFVSDAGGFSDVYRVSLGTGEVRQVTRLATGVSGITSLSPALSIAQQTGHMVFSVFENGGYSVYALGPERSAGEPVAPAAAEVAAAGILPPAEAAGAGVVATYLADPATGLPGGGFDAHDYRPSLSLDYVGAQAVGGGIALTGDRFGSALGGGISLFFSDMLGDHAVGGAVQANGGVEDIGGQAFYTYREHRWNWGGVVGHLPFLTGFTHIGVNPDGSRRIEQFRDRVFLDQVMGITQYPFSLTRRFEASLGYTRVSFNREVERLTVIGGQITDRQEQELDAPDALNFIESSAALVGDNSFFGFTSPVAGWRYRFEASPAFGTLT